MYCLLAKIPKTQKKITLQLMASKINPYLLSKMKYLSNKWEIKIYSAMQASQVIKKQC